MISNRKLDINFVCMQPNLSGAYKATKLLAEALVQQGHRVSVIYLCDVHRPPITQPKRLLRHLRELWSARGSSLHHFVDSTATLLPVHGSKVRAADVPDADISIGMMWETREWIEEWPANKGLKAYIVTGDERLRGGDIPRIEAVQRLPGIHFAVATWVQQLLREHYNVPGAVLLPNGVEANLLDAPARCRGRPPTVGLMYGRSPLKGADVAFDAIRLAQREVPDLRAIAFGAAPIHWRHRPPRPFEFRLRPRQTDLPSIYQRADCWLLPSTSEGFGMPGLEAAASRCPVIATRCGGPADYIQEGGSGFLVDVGDKKTMARRLVETLLCDPENWKSMSDRAHKIATHFTWEHSATILVQTAWAHRAVLSGTDMGVTGVVR